MDTGPEPESVSESIDTFLENAAEPVYIVRPSSELIDLLVRTASQHTTTPLYVLAPEAELKSLRRHFPSATRAAELVSREQLTLTPSPPDGWGSVVANRDGALAVSQVADHRLAFETSAVPEELIDTCARHRETGEEFDLRTPAWGTVTETLAETLGEPVRDDFTTAIETIDSMTDPVIDETGCALLVAARHELLLYDLSGWGDDIRLCSKATFSRVKGELDDAAVLESEKVQMEIGRPRLRLTLADEYASLSVPELLRKVNTAIAD